MSTPNYESLRRVPIPPSFSYNNNNNNNNDLFPQYYSHSRNSSRARSDTSSSSSGTTEVIPLPASSNKNTTRVGAHDVEKIKGSKGKSGWRGCAHFFLEVLPRGWSIEILSCIMSLAALVAIIIVLKEYDQQTMPSWPLGITLNTLLAFLTAISQAGFFNPVFQGLSQMKWNWFVDKDKPLADFEKFDNASRGSWGSFLLVFSMKGRHSVLMATVILVSSTITSTITQAVLTQGTRYIPGGGTASIYNMVNDFSSPLTSMNDVTGILISSMFTSVNSTYNYTQPTCTSGNCKFPIFSSLAVCVDTADITDKLIPGKTPEQCCWQNVTAENKWEPWTWPKPICSNCTRAGLSRNDYIYLKPGNTYSLNSSSTPLEGDYLDPNQVDAWDRLYSFSNSTFGYNGIAATQIIYLNVTNSTTHMSTSPDANNITMFMPITRAVEALFYMCVETYNVTTVNGTTHTNVTSVDKEVADFYTYGYLDEGHSDVLYNRTFVVDGRNYTYSDLTKEMSQVLMNTLSGEFDFGPNFAGIGFMTPFGYAIGQTLYNNYKLSLSGGVERDQLMFQNIDTVLKNMARGMTNWIRSSYSSPIEGKNYVSDTYVIVRWPFIACLAIQVVFSIIFLAWIMLDTKMRKVGILKESALATLFAVHAEDKLTLENRLSLVDDERNAIADVGNSSKAHLTQGALGQWHLKLAKQF